MTQVSHLISFQKVPRVTINQSDFFADCSQGGDSWSISLQLGNGNLVEFNEWYHANTMLWGFGGNYGCLGTMQATG